MQLSTTATGTNIDFSGIQTHFGPLSYGPTLAWFAAKRPLVHQEDVEIEASRLALPLTHK